MVEFVQLRDGPKGRVPEIRNAYRFLRGAHSTVSGLLDVSRTMAAARRASNTNAQGRMRQEEVDLLRSAIVFTSSGLDASMKRLVNDAGRYLIAAGSKGARSQYAEFLKRELTSATTDSNLRSAVVSADPADELVTYYLKERTKASFQGSGDLSTRVRKCLGIPDSRIPESDLKSLDRFFTVRNSIVHSMDYVNVDQSNRTSRTHRSVDDATALCNRAFELAADLIHAAAEVVLAARSGS